MSHQATESLRKRLRSLRASRSTGEGTSTSSVFSPMAGGGLFRQSTIQPISFGEEVALVRDSSQLCLGKIGCGGNVCLKCTNDCDTETHSKNKGTLPNDPFLILLKGKDKGYETVVLNAGPLENTFITELLSKSDIHWPSEFAKIEENESKNSGDMDIVEEVLNTAKAQKKFSTPGKTKSTDQIMDSLSLLDVTMDLITDASSLVLTEDGEGLDNFSFEQQAYKTFCQTVSDKLEIIFENAKSFHDVLLDVQPFVQGQTKPIEHTVAGLRLEFASIKAMIGTKDLSKKDIPPCVWSAIETGFESCLKLEKRVEEVSALAAEAHEVAGELLTSAEDSTAKVTFKDEKNTSTNSDSFLENLSKPTMINGHLYQPKQTSSVSQSSNSGGNGSGNNNNSGNNSQQNNNWNHNPTPPSGSDCDRDELLCGRCMVRFQELDDKITSTTIRLGNLEDAKNGNIESAILIKNKIYRGRADIMAQLDDWFPVESEQKIDAGLFPTPYLILNLMHADMCSKRGPKIPLDEMALVKNSIRRSDADAFYSLKKDKPMFFITKELCPNFAYRSSEAQKKKALIPFLPSHEDFGNGLDSDSLHYMFKQSLEHVRSERERYIETSLNDHPDLRALSVAKQLLDDTCKFIRQMLSFMEEVYASCADSFGATSEAWDLVSHCILEIFAKELKPSLKLCVAFDLVDMKAALVGAVHTAFHMNCKLRELVRIGLKNHHTTTTSHVRFVMKMAKVNRKNDVSAKAKPSVEKNPNEAKMLTSIASLQKENKELKAYLQRLESKLDSVIAKNNLESPTKAKKARVSSSTSKEKVDGDESARQ
jgi:hypothetical protein